MVNQDVHNQVVVAERAKAPSGAGRARATIMTGKVKHECNLRPRMTGRYERRLAAKNEKAVRVGLMDGAKAGRGGGKMLSSPRPVSRTHGADISRAFFFFLFEIWILTLRSVRRSSFKKDSTSAWRVCPGTNCSTRSLRSFASANSGRSNFFVRRYSSRRCISEKSCQKSPRCIAVASSTARGSSCQALRHVAVVCVAAV